MFFEFKAAEAGKIRYRFSFPNHESFAFAGLFNLFQGSLDTMAFITAAASESFSPYHHRQPVMLAKADDDRWPDLKLPDAELKAMLLPWPSELAGKPEPNNHTSIDASFS